MQYLYRSEIHHKQETLDAEYSPRQREVAAGEATVSVCPGDLAQTLQILTRIIHERRSANPAESYTARLLTGELDKLLKKIGEESTELIMAVKDDDHDHIRYEAADLLYHLLVVFERTGISLEELAGELDARMP